MEPYDANRFAVKVDIGHFSRTDDLMSEYIKSTFEGYDKIWTGNEAMLASKSSACRAMARVFYVTVPEGCTMDELMTHFENVEGIERVNRIPMMGTP